MEAGHRIIAVKCTHVRSVMDSNLIVMWGAQLHEDKLPTQQAGPCTRLIRRTASCLALEGCEEVLTQLLWDVILQVSGHEELEALIINGLHGRGESKQARELLRYTYFQIRSPHQPQMDSSFVITMKERNMWWTFGAEADLPWDEGLQPWPVVTCQYFLKSLMMIWFEAIKVENILKRFYSKALKVGKMSEAQSLSTTEHLVKVSRGSMEVLEAAPR